VICTVARMPPVGSCAALLAIKEIRKVVAPALPGQYCRAIRVIAVLVYVEGTVKLTACAAVMGL
jgi:hypothetical protein